MAVVPYSGEKTSKKEQVAKMFNNISRRYDFLNHFLSLGIDRGWRKKAIDYLRPLAPRNILDVATGTGDFALQAMVLNPEKIIGVDISEGMLDVGRRKVLGKGCSRWWSSEAAILRIYPLKRTVLMPSPWVLAYGILRTWNAA